MSNAVAVSIGHFLLACVLLPAVMIAAIMVLRGYAPTIDVLGVFILFAPATFFLYGVISLAYLAVDRFRQARHNAADSLASHRERASVVAGRVYVVLSAPLVMVHEAFSARSLLPALPLAVLVGAGVLFVNNRQPHAR